jgi:glycosyltransferase involved in cell wall biosynthesis
MRLLIVEPEAEGHHMILYTRLLVREALRRNWEVAILTTEHGRNHPAFGILIADHGSALQTIEMQEVSRTASGSISLLASQLLYWSALARACTENNRFRDFDLIYCINLDYFEKALSVRGSPFGNRPFAGMLMNPKFHMAPLGLGPPSRSDRIYRALFKRMLRIRALKWLFVIDKPFQEFCLREQFAHAEKIRVVADVGELSLQCSVASARDKLGLSSDVFVILLYGSLSRRKGVEQLLRAVESLGEAKVVALVAGKPDDEIAELLSSNWCRDMQKSGQLVARAEFHDDQSEAEVFCAANLVWLGYTGGSFGSSGVLYQAGSAGLPVISMAEGLVGWAVREYDLGITLDPDDSSAVVDAINRLRCDKSMLKRFGDNGRRVAKHHTGAEFANTICSALEASGSVANG